MNAPRLILGDCVAEMAKLPSASIDAIVCDPPYPMIKRAYGMMTEAAWHDMMRGVVAESRRVLKPRGSAVFILQPNMEKIGRMRLWLWEFIVWAGKEWNLVQDVYWWNIAALPQTGGIRPHGLCRPSVKPCVWLGDPDCWRDQEAVLWEESDANKANRLGGRCSNELKHCPHGKSHRELRNRIAAGARGGVTPFNLIPMASVASSASRAAKGHPAMTPEPLTNWWVRYICPPGGVVLDPFCGSGTTGRSAVRLGREFIGIERDPGYHATSERLIAAEAESLLPL